MFTLAIVGHINVGKTSFFNILTKTNYYYISNKQNFSFDFFYGICFFKNKYCICIDTCSFLNLNILKKNKNKLNKYIYDKFIYVAKNVDFICLLVDINIGLIEEDILLFKFFFKYNKNIILIINKIDLCCKIDFYNNISSFNYLGINKIYNLSIKKKIGISVFIKDLFNLKNKFFYNKKKNLFYFKEILLLCNNLDVYYNYLNYLFNNNNLNLKKENKYLNYKNIIKIIIIGKQNVGKSTFLNSISGINRSFVDNFYGTTKDYIFLYKKIYNIFYCFIDTPGFIRYKGKKKLYFLNKFFYKFFDLKIIFYIVDIYYGISKYDLFLLNFFLNKGKIVYLFFNKCDKIKNFNKKIYKSILLKKFDFIKRIKLSFISAININKLKLKNLFISINKNYINIFIKKINSYLLTNILILANKNFIEKNNVNFNLKLKYAHIGGYYPFTIIIHGKNINLINNSYKKYLCNFFIKNLNIFGINIFLKFKEISN